jgi:fatty-acyl-CoA synthase
MIEMTMGELLEQQVQQHGETEAVVYPFEGIRWTYKEFNEKANQVAKGLHQVGVKKGDHVAIWATNIKEWILIQYATAKIGAVMVTVNTAYRSFELEYLMTQSDSMTLVMTGGIKGSDYVEYINTVCPELKDSKPGEIQSEKLPFLKNVIFVGDETPAGMMPFNELYDKAKQVPNSLIQEIGETLDCHDVVNMQYTSGTTGFPKGVMLTHYNVINNGQCIGDCMNFTEKDRLLIHVPLFHCFGCVLGVMASVTHATTMVFIDHFNPIQAMQAIQDEKCTAVHGVPTMFISMLGNEAFSQYDYSSLRTGIMAGSPCPIEVMREVVDKMNMSEITIAYGQTEASPVVTQTRTYDSLEKRVTTVGKSLPNVEVKIIDPETGKDSPCDTKGEIVARGYCVMKGYYKMEEATKQAIDESGWLHTGDLGTMDEDGYFKVTGRLKDMIIRGGENIYPREIEEFLYTHEAVKDVQVVGIPDEKYGEEVIAFVIPNEGEIPTEDEFVDFVKKGLSKFKAPRYVRIIDAFPMTASGKIQKYKLREIAIKDLKLEKVAEIETA